MRNLTLAALAATVTFAAPAFAQNINVTDLNGGQGVYGPASEQNPGSSSSIVAGGIDGDGSLQINGDRNRVLNGNNYAATSNYGALSSVSSLTGDYIVLDGGNGGIQSPAFRVYVQDGGARSELIWEAAYNGGYTLGAKDSVLGTDQFWKYLAGCGYVGTNGCGSGSYVTHTITEWADLFSSNAFVSAIGVGNGGGAGASFSALADNVSLNYANGTSLTYNFTTGVAAVPEPSTWALMLLGFGGMGVAMRRQRRSATLLTQAA